MRWHIPILGYHTGSLLVHPVMPAWPWALPQTIRHTFPFSTSTDHRSRCFADEKDEPTQANALRLSFSGLRVSLRNKVANRGSHSWDSYPAVVNLMCGSFNSTHHAVSLRTFSAPLVPTDTNVGPHVTTTRRRHAKLVATSISTESLVSVPFAFSRG